MTDQTMSIVPRAELLGELLRVGGPVGKTTLPIGGRRHSGQTEQVAVIRQAVAEHEEAGNIERAFGHEQTPKLGALRNSSRSGSVSQTMPIRGSSVFKMSRPSTGFLHRHHAALRSPARLGRAGT